MGDTVSFGLPASFDSPAKFGTYWVKDGKLVGAFLEGGSPDENKAIARAARKQPAVESVEAIGAQGLAFAISVEE